MNIYSLLSLSLFLKMSPSPSIGRFFQMAIIPRIDAIKSPMLGRTVMYGQRPMQRKPIMKRTIDSTILTAIFICQYFIFYSFGFSIPPRLSVVSGLHIILMPYNGLVYGAFQCAIYVVVCWHFLILD